MNTRRFFLITCTIIAVFLFFSGSAILAHINTLSDLGDETASHNNIVSDFLKPFVIGKDPVNFLILIGDKGEANTDTIMLANFNPSTNKINILSIPRDTRVNVKGLTIPKINSIYARKDGPNLIVETVSNLLDVNVNYYVYFNISTFREIIDLLGGVDITVPVNMDYDDPTQNLHIHLKKGRQRLDGKKAEQFLRFRHPNVYTEEIKKYYDGSDIKRIEAQQYFLKELIKQKANIFYFTKLNSIIDVIYKNLETNITINEIMKFAKNINDISINNVTMFTLPGTSRKDNGIWYYIMDREEAQNIVKENFYSKEGFSDYTNKNSEKKGNNNSNGNGNNDVNKKNNNNHQETISPSKQDKDFIKDNPSNTESSIEGSPTPIP